jgi:hypothetical protein
MEELHNFAPVIDMESAPVNAGVFDDFFFNENTPETVVAPVENPVDLRPMVCLVYKDYNEQVSFMLFSSSDAQQPVERLITGVNYHIGYQSSNSTDTRINYGTYIGMYQIPSDKITVSFDDRSPGLWLYSNSSDEPIVDIPAQYSENELISMNVSEANSNNYAPKYAYHNVV